MKFFFNRKFLSGKPGAIRFLAFQNRGNMGKYREAIERFQAGFDLLPDVTAHPRRTRGKFGFGINAEQELSNLLRVFSRYGWNDDRFESFNYTEVGNSFQFGGDIKGNLWKRGNDKIGAAFVTNGINRNHREYLALGGKGFILGDGGLNYGRENIFETYYNLRLWRGVSTAFDAQYVGNPGYNRDRGPVVVPSLRLHLEF